MTARVEITKHFDYLTPFSEAENERELEQILRLKYPKVCSNLETDASSFARMVGDIQKYEAWRVMAPSFEAFCRDKLEMTIDRVETIVAGVKALQEQGNAKPTAAEAVAAARKIPTPSERGEQGGRGNKAGSNPTSFGRGRSYLAARLKRDHPEIVARVQAGEFKSVHAAAVAAGIRKPTATIPVDTAEAAVAALLRRFTRTELVDAIRKAK